MYIQDSHNLKNLEQWILQLDNHFTITQLYKMLQRPSHFGLCMEGDAFAWWKANKYRINTSEEVKHATREYYDNHYKPARAFNEMNDPKQTNTV